MDSSKSRPGRCTYRDGEPIPQKWIFSKSKKMTLWDKSNFWYLRYLIATSTFMLEVSETLPPVGSKKHEKIITLFEQSI